MDVVSEEITAFYAFWFYYFVAETARSSSKIEPLVSSDEGPPEGKNETVAYFYSINHAPKEKNSENQPAVINLLVLFSCY